MDGFTKIRLDADKLRQARERRGLEQAETARAVGVTRQQIWAYEQPGVQSSPRADVLARLCKLYEVDIAELTTESATAEEIAA